MSSQVTIGWLMLAFVAAVIAICVAIAAFAAA